MGMPEIIINFREAQGTFLYRLTRGIVCYLHFSATATTPEMYTIKYKTDTETILEEATDTATLTPQVKRMFDLGASKVLVVVSKDFASVEDWLYLQRFNYLTVACNGTEDENILEWCEGIEFRAGRKFMLIWDSTKKISTVGVNNDLNRFVVSTYPAASTGIPFGTPMDCAAVIAGTGSLERSATFYVLAYNDELTDEQLALYPGAWTDTADEKINGGQMCIVNDGEKIKIGRAVTAFYHADTDTPSNDTTERSFSKVRAVDIMNMIEDDIRDNYDEQYVGKVLNSYANKMGFVSLCNAEYLAGLLGTALDPDGVNAVDIDEEEQIAYIQREGIQNPDDMTEMEIRKYNTGSKLYLAGQLRILDTMEDLNLNFVI